MTCRSHTSSTLAGLSSAIALIGLSSIAAADSSARTPSDVKVAPATEMDATTKAMAGSEELARQPPASDEDVYPLPAIYEPPEVTIDDLSPSLIAKIQRALKQYGYALGRADGVVGPMTRLALNDFLAAHGWPTGYLLNDRVLRGLGIAPDHLSD